MFLAACCWLVFAPVLAAQSAPEDTARLIHQSWFASASIRESSALAASRKQPGIFWTLNDSGNPAQLFAIDSSGQSRGIVAVEGAENRDWEGLALARCRTGDCLYIADTGDNRQRRRSIRIFRVPEPATGSASAPTISVNGSLELTYDDGPRNVEAIFVTPSQDLYLISKERSGGGRLYHVGADAWGSPTGRAVARFIQELPFPDGLGYQVTDAALHPDGERVAVRTYRYIVFFRLRDGKLVADGPRCDAGGLDALGEGITWLADGRLATTSERVMMLGGTISLLECG